MATTKNKNLFYLLYSKNNTVAESGFSCSSSINESDTSFDISGSEALITDSNGDILAALDLSQIHESEITLYNVETRILQPHSAYLLQGNEYGETFKALFFLINKQIYTVEYYDSYCNILFDILYKQNGKLCNVHVNTDKIRNDITPVTELAQVLLQRLKVPVSVSIRLEEDQEISTGDKHYICFQSTTEGYDFIVRNVILTPVLRGETSDYDSSESPFDSDNITSDYILDLLEKHKVKHVNLHESSQDTYKIGCGLYRSILKLSRDILDDFKKFCSEIDLIEKYILPLFDSYGNYISVGNMDETIISLYPEVYMKYFTEQLQKYNINDFIKMLKELQSYVYTQKIKYGPLYCFEDINKRINYLKYPNGALRGVVIIPQWPVNEDYDSCVLWLNHVADKVEICVPVSQLKLESYFGVKLQPNKTAHLFEKAIASVKINALIPSEKELYIEDYNNLPLSDISSNDGFSTSFDFLLVPAFDCHDFIDNQFHRVPGNPTISGGDLYGYDTEPEYAYTGTDITITDSITNDVLWQASSSNIDGIHYVDTHEDLTNKFIGLYKYMEYLTNNDIWTRVGDGYMALGKMDDFLSKQKNLLLSVLLYNPNDIPIKVKYIIFS